MNMKTTHYVLPSTMVTYGRMGHPTKRFAKQYRADMNTMAKLWTLTTNK